MKSEKVHSLIVFLFFLIAKFSFAQEIEHNHSIYHSFIENKGQWAEDVLFKSKFKGGNLWVQQHKLLFHFQDFSQLNKAHLGKESVDDIFISESVVQLNFLGSNEVSDIQKNNSTPNYYNYFIGNDPSKWASGVYGYNEAILKNFYTGIDLKLIENKQELKYEFHVQPKVDPSQIVLEYLGQKNLKIDETGSLIFETALGRVVEKKPYTYQIINGKIVDVNCSFIIDNQKVKFDIANYNDNYELVIDPILVFATYSGSVSDNFGMTATYGYDGTAYSAGTVFGNNYPSPDLSSWNTTSVITVPNVNSATSDVFLSKYSEDGKTMLWTNFIGGGNNTIGTETAHSLICDKNNNVYIYGATSSSDFPILGGYQPVHGGGSALSVAFNGAFFDNQGIDIFIVKLSSDGKNLLGSTYMGGSNNDGVNYNISSGNYGSIANYDSLTTNYGDQFRGEIMLDNMGNCIIASSTRSLDFPVLQPFQSSNAGEQDGVIFKLSSNLSTLLWSSYFGGSKNDACYSVKIDSSYNIVFSGGTTSIDLPNTSGGWQPIYNGGKTDGFVGKLDPSGNVVTQVSYVGTSDYDQAFFVEIDRNDNVFLLGQSRGGIFPVVNAGFQIPNSGQFICKLASDLKSVLNATVFGNGNPVTNISPSAFLVDICGNIYVSGWGASILGNQLPLNGMPVSSNAFQNTPPNGFDFYLMVVDRKFDNLIYGSYLGGALSQEHVDGGTSRFDKKGIVYQSVCGGCWANSDFPTTAGAWSNTNLSTGCNNLIFKFDFSIIPQAKVTVDKKSGCKDFEVTFNNSSTISDTYLWDFDRAINDTSSIIHSPTILYKEKGIYHVVLTIKDSICQIADTAIIDITVLDSLKLDVVCDNSLPLCNPKQIVLTAKNEKTADYIIWSSSSAFLDTLNNSILDSTLTILPIANAYYYVKIGNAACFKIDSIFVETINYSVSLQGGTSLCLNEITEISANNSHSSLNFSYTWSPDAIILSGQNSDKIKIDPKSSKFVYLAVNYLNQCYFKDSIFVNVSSLDTSLVHVNASEYFVPKGAIVQLTGAPIGYNYSWQPNEGVVNPVSISTNAKVIENTIYKLTVADQFCSASDSVLVKVYNYVCDDPSVFIPNAFSPNGDGNNDKLMIRGDMLKDLTFKVFDRWGELIFETHERGIGWDGTFKGKKMDPDVYDYYLKATCLDNTESLIKGNITLLK